MTPSLRVSTVSVLLGIPAALLALPLQAAPADAQSTYQAAPSPTRTLRSANGLTIEVLVEAAGLGGTEVDIAEITFPPGPTPARGHRHGSTEIFYILEGELNHIVNGTSHRLTPGMVGIVRAGDEVIHGVASAGPVRALVIWAPGGEVERIAPGFAVQPAQ
jgi:uncharacterized cupin superfamily protein